MSRFFRDYHAATGFARKQATATKCCYGVAKVREYGKPGFVVTMIPTDPYRRYGRDAACEPITPGEPLSTSEIYALAGLPNG